LVDLSAQANARLFGRALNWCGDWLEVGLVVAIVIAFHMVHGAAITFLEAFAEVLASLSFNGRVLVHFMVVGIGMATLAEIVPCSFNALVETALLRIAVFGGRLVPAVVIVILRESRSGDGLCFMRAGFQSAG
jgi:hypothetical protein